MSRRVVNASADMHAKSLLQINSRQQMHSNTSFRFTHRPASIYSSAAAYISSLERPMVRYNSMTTFSPQCACLLSMNATKCCCHCWRRIGKISSAFVLSIFLSCAILSARGFSSAAWIDASQDASSMWHIHDWCAVCAARLRLWLSGTDTYHQDDCHSDVPAEPRSQEEVTHRVQ